MIIPTTLEFEVAVDWLINNVGSEHCEAEYIGFTLRTRSGHGWSIRTSATLTTTQTATHIKISHIWDTRVTINDEKLGTLFALTFQNEY